MDIGRFLEILGADFYTGVPDSQLKALCDYLMDKYGVNGAHHIIAANEGGCTAIAAGYHLATGKIPVVYMQNSGEGNIINPVASLMNDKVYGIPCIFIIGWRGEPGIHDEPQHKYQGEITLELLKVMEIEAFIIDGNTTEKDIEETMNRFQLLLESGKQVSFVVRKGALNYDNTPQYINDNKLIREEILSHIIDVTGDDPIISTTGKTSRELFELRVSRKEAHGHDFLTVGSMGHSASIALGVALQRSEKKVWIIDGDGSMLMHMGSLAVVGACKPSNIVHVVINNSSHESVGGQPTVANHINISKIAQGCGYESVVSVDTLELLDDALAEAKEKEVLSFIEVKSAIGSRADLGRPTTAPKDNKDCFMDSLSK